MSYSPIERAQEVESEVTKYAQNGQQLRYYFKSFPGSDSDYLKKDRSEYKFRPTNYYGGSACADVVGCNIECRYCWVEDINKHVDPLLHTFYSPEEVVHELLRIADEKKYKIIRLSGGEATLSRDHLMSILKILKEREFDNKFLLETNGILIGNDPSFAEELKEYKKFLHVRVSLKGTTPESFAINTGARPEFFEFQKNALSNCLENNIDCHAVVMVDCIQTGNDLKQLISSLKKKNLASPIEFERLFKYPHVIGRIRARKIMNAP